FAPVERDSNQGIDSLAIFMSVIFPHTNQTSPAGVDYGVSVTSARGAGIRPGRSREQFWRRAIRLLIKLLIRKVRKVDGAVVYQIIAPAILVHTSTDVEPRRRYIDVVAVCGPSNDHLAPAFGRPHLDPVNVTSIQRDLAQADGFFNN